MNKIISALGLTFMLSIMGFVGTWEAQYDRLAVCTHYDSASDVYTFTDNSGNNWLWERETGEVFEIGNAYRLVMDDMHSTDIHDDWIKKVKNI